MKLPKIDRPKKPLHLLSWAFCLFFCLCISAGGFITTLCMTGCAVLVSPPLRTKFHLPKKLWLPAVVVLFLIGCMASPTAAQPSDAISPSSSQSSSLLPEEEDVSSIILSETPATPDTSSTTQTEASSHAEPESDTEPIADTVAPAEGAATSGETSPENNITYISGIVSDSDSSTVSDSSEAEEGSGTIVYITNTGSKYHLGTCSTLKKSKIAITLEEAKAQGYEPCKICQPPT